MRIGVVVPAAGAARRMGQAKPWLELRGVPVLLRALLPFLAFEDVVAVIVALGDADSAQPPAWLRTLDPRVRLVVGGAERGDSVAAALAALPPDVDVVLVHDAARPLVSADLIARVVAAVDEATGAVPGLPPSDTVQQVDGQERVSATPSRAQLRAVQTPQAFPAAGLRAAYRHAGEEGAHYTDDAALFRHWGGMVRVVPGDARNLKLTTPLDLRIAEALLDAHDPAAADR